MTSSLRLIRLQSNLNRFKIDSIRSFHAVTQVKKNNKNGGNDYFVSKRNYSLSHRIFPCLSSSSSLTMICKSQPLHNGISQTIVGTNSNVAIIPVRGLKVSTAQRDIFKVQDEKDFQEKVINSKIPVIVDFYATWCGPCKLLTPRLETIVATKKGSINLAMVDIDEQEDIAIKYEVSSIPSVMVFKDGKVQDSFLGLKDDDQIRAFVEKAGK